MGSRSTRRRLFLEGGTHASPADVARLLRQGHAGRLREGVRLQGEDRLRRELGRLPHQGCGREVGIRRHRPERRGRRGPDRPRAPDSWAVIWNPKPGGGATMLNDKREAFAAAMRLDGSFAKGMTAETIKAAAKRFEGWKPRAYESSP